MVQRKGGNLAGLALSAEVRHEVPQRAVGEAERGRNFREGSVLQEHRAEGLVATLEGVGRLVKEVRAGGVVHGVLGNCHGISASDRP